jgi:hypothetical protein
VELIAFAFILVAGGGLAVFAMTAMALAEKEKEHAAAQAPPQRDSIAASILAQILVAGGANDEDALRDIRRKAGLGAPVTRGVDVANWAEAYARVSDRPQCAALLETAVQLIAGREAPVPLRQYTALLDLSFSLGFQTDALAKLREQYGFTYVDHAKDARPRDADRAGGAAPLFVREETSSAELLRELGLDAGARRPAIISAYRRLAAQHHPDRFHGQANEVQSAAAARFIRITQAYETLLAIHRD